MMMGHVPANPGLVRTGAGISMMAGLGDGLPPAAPSVQLAQLNVWKAKMLSMIGRSGRTPAWKARMAAWVNMQYNFRLANFQRAGLAGLGDDPLPASMCLESDMAGDCQVYGPSPTQTGSIIPVGGATGSAGAPAQSGILSTLTGAFSSASSAFPWLVIAAIAVLSSTGGRRR